MKVVFLSGIPGAGKNTYIAKNFPGAIVCSMDDFFTDEKGNYNWVGAKIPAAAKACFEKFQAAIDSMYCAEYTYDANDMVGSTPTIVLNNCNTKVSDMSKYYDVVESCRKNGVEVDLEIVTILCDPETAFKRGAHKVPLETVKRMFTTLLGRRIPKDWQYRQTTLGTVKL